MQPAFSRQEPLRRGGREGEYWDYDLHLCNFYFPKLWPPALVNLLTGAGNLRGRRDSATSRFTLSPQFDPETATLSRTSCSKGIQGRLRKKHRTRVRPYRYCYWYVFVPFTVSNFVLHHPSIYGMAIYITGIAKLVVPINVITRSDWYQFCIYWHIMHPNFYTTIHLYYLHRQPVFKAKWWLYLLEPLYVC